MTAYRDDTFPGGVAVCLEAFAKLAARAVEYVPDTPARAARLWGAAEACATSLARRCRTSIMPATILLWLPLGGARSRRLGLSLD